jgi:hypothetical protein
MALSLPKLATGTVTNALRREQHHKDGGAREEQRPQREPNKAALFALLQRRGGRKKRKECIEGDANSHQKEPVVLSIFEDTPVNIFHPFPGSLGERSRDVLRTSSEA